MKIQRKTLHLTRITADILFLLVAFFLAILLGHRTNISGLSVIHNFFILILVLTWLYFSRVIGLYDEFRSRNFSFELINLIKNVLIQSFTAIVFIFFIKEIDLSRKFVVRYSLSLLILLGCEKYIFRKLLETFRKRGRNLRSVLIIGAGPVGQKFYNAINDNPHFGYRLLGFLDDEKKPFLNGQYLGKIENLENIFEKNNVDDVIIALPNYAENRIDEVIAICESNTTRVRIIPDYFKFFSQKYSISMFGRFPVISVRDDQLNELHWRLLKRAFDTIITIILFVTVLSWLWPVIALAIKMTSKGPVLFKQERWGRNNKKFLAYKFRSMRTDSIDVNSSGKYQQATKDDPRITKIGRLLRKTNLDELPQLINVLKGEMSLVGPRPHPIPLNLESKENIKNYMLRHLVKPGLTGWAQVNGYRGETKDPGLMEKRVEHDIWYIEHWSFWLDLQILLFTAWNMIKGDPNAY
ncbi:MAG: undecaprenyl-phosphate glucose phosphotransferase [Ignavibacteriales bacterium]